MGRAWWGLWALAACAGGGKDAVDDTDVMDTDVEDTTGDTTEPTDTVETADTTEPLDTTDTTETADTTDTTDTTAEVPSTYTFPTQVATEDGANANMLGGYSRVMLTVYDTTQLPTAPVQIREVRFRRWAQSATADQAISIPGVQLWIGTGAEPYPYETFADNFTGDEVQIFNGQLDVAANGADPLAFDDWIVPIDPPFAFDPADGTLLFDFRIPAMTTTPLDLECRNDGALQMKLNWTAGEQTTGPISTGCGYIFQIAVD